ncbi:ABC transporter ATP-binding protein [Sodalis sp. RH16]|uniref:ABC transporter ATP-binding protein n=1 Tax=unclassified Sodalis (in: enterobacteria) TaxID=2636512 RepID=UPI0039B483A2
MSRVALNNIEKEFHGHRVIDGIDLTIEDGEFIALVGPSGCGKSTLLRIISGLETASKGQILIDDKVVNALRPKDRNIAMVFQNYALYPHMTVRRNISLNLEIAGLGKKEIDERVDKAVKLLEIEELLDRRPSQLSGGQRQRVAMGRAIVREPSVFLFDEPLSNLDAKLRAQMRIEIKSLHRTLATTLIYVTHDQLEAMTLADRIVVLNRGVIEQVGPPMELYLRPKNQFVATFIGSPSMNLLPATVRTAAGETSLVLAEDVTLRLPFTLPDRQAVTLGIRPENLVIDGPGLPLEATVLFNEPSGAYSLVSARIGQNMSLSLMVDGYRSIEAGQRLRLGILPEHIHLFDAQSQKSLREGVPC